MEYMFATQNLTASVVFNSLTNSNRFTPENISLTGVNYPFSIRGETLKPENLFHFNSQKYMPLYAIDPGNSMFVHEGSRDNSSGLPTDNAVPLVNIGYYKPDIAYSLYTMPKYTSSVLQQFFNLRMLANGAISKVVFQFNNEPFTVYVGAGLLLDEVGKVLAITVLNKEIMNYINSFPVSSNKRLQFYKEFFDKTKQAEILNVFGNLMVSKEFFTERKYKNLLNMLSSQLLESNDYKLDLIVSRDIESRVFNIGRTVTLSYTSVREKVTFQKNVWRKVLT